MIVSLKCLCHDCYTRSAEEILVFHNDSPRVVGWTIDAGNLWCPVVDGVEHRPLVEVTNEDDEIFMTHDVDKVGFAPKCAMCLEELQGTLTGMEVKYLNAEKHYYELNTETMFCREHANGGMYFELSVIL